MAIDGGSCALCWTVSSRHSFVTGVGRTGATLRTIVNTCGVIWVAENHC